MSCHHPIFHTTPPAQALHELLIWNVLCHSLAYKEVLQEHIVAHLPPIQCSLQLAPEILARALIPIP